MKNTIDMTTGAVSRNIVYFALPVFIGSMFQQLYNTADSLFVGNFIGSRALAAVSSAGYLIFLLVGFFDGVFMGAGVVIGHFIGAKDASQTQKAVHTTVSLGLITGALLTVLGIFLAPVILRLIGTPDEVMAESLVYFRIYFSGSLVLVLYNTFTGILRAAGDSKSPLYFLIVSSVANIALDFFFVGVLRLGVGSVALATVISETLSVVLCLKKLLTVEGSHRLYLKKISIDISLFKKIIRIGVPSGAQNSIIGFANIVVQSHINSFGALAMAAVSYPTNYFIVYPAYARMWFGGTVDPIVGMYRTILPAADTLEKALLIFNVPFTLAKGLIVAAITMFIYKPLSNLIVKMNDSLSGRKKG